MTETYILNTNDNARNRLSLQHHLYAQSSVNLLHKAGVRPGMKGLEIGCGSGAMTIELARLIGDQGRLLSIDISPEQIEYVKKHTEDYKNILFKVWDINHLSDIGEQFDFIYCRMVLHHLADAHSALVEMRNCLPPGGVIICEEPSIFDSTFCYPPSQAYNQFTQLVRACFSLNERDFEIAHRLEQEFSSLQFKILHHSLYQPLLRTPQEKQIYYMALDDVTPQILEHQLITQEEIDELSRELRALANSESTMSWIRMHNIIATT